MSELTLRQEYKLAIAGGLACSPSTAESFAETAGAYADALLKEDELHAARMLKIEKQTGGPDGSTKQTQSHT